MHRIRNIATVPLTVLCFFGLASAVGAHYGHPTPEYCRASLRGYTTQAPDNDVKRLWDNIERVHRVNVVSSSPRASNSPPSQPHWVYQSWAFYYNGGASQINYTLWCYESGGYHDQDPYIG